MRRFLAAALALMLLPACAVPAANAPAFQAAATAEPRFHAILVAGDPSLEVWDRAVERFAAQLEAGGQAASIRRFTARADRKGRGGEPARRRGVLEAIATLNPAPGEACLVFLTMHGAPDEGLAFVLDRTFLTPAQLDAALGQGCATAPTFVITSSCFSGGFAAAPMARPNRVVLTASRADRSSFGCSPRFALTVFDRCVLEALGAAPTLAAEVAQSSRACVEREEFRLQLSPASEPQSFVGRQVAGLVPRLVRRRAGE